MPTYKCKECGNNFHYYKKKCPNCGKPVSKFSGGLGCLTIIVVFVVIILMVIGNQSEKEKEKVIEKNWETSDNSIMAYIMMQDFVTDRLKSPSTADFPNYSGHVKYLGNQEYKINSYVDAQNSFGAMIRTKFIGKIKQTSEGRWNLIDLNLY